MRVRAEVELDGPGAAADVLALRAGGRLIRRETNPALRRARAAPRARLREEPPPSDLTNRLATAPVVTEQEVRRSKEEGEEEAPLPMAPCRPLPAALSTAMPAPHHPHQRAFACPSSSLADSSWPAGCVIQSQVALHERPAHLPPDSPQPSTPPSTRGSHGEGGVPHTPPSTGSVRDRVRRLNQETLAGTEAGTQEDASSAAARTLPLMATPGLPVLAPGQRRPAGSRFALRPSSGTAARPPPAIQPLQQATLAPAAEDERVSLSEVSRKSVADFGV